MIEISEISELRKAIASARKKRKTIGFVPTMGFLHEGHLSLVKRSKADRHFTVVSIFVNPTQFAPSEDLDNYPRDYERDKKLLKELGTDLIFYPSRESLYGPDFSTWIIEDSDSNKLCGKARKGHFKGVLTIVAKLFNIVMPDVAYFGRKDFQQAYLIKKMIRELDFPVEIIVSPTIRESDGLAMSSRNSYLDTEQRRDALIFIQTLKAVARLFESGERNVEKLLTAGKLYFTENSGTAEFEYLEILNAEDLREIENVERVAVCTIAGKVGQTRLIDNILLPPDEPFDF